MKGGRRKTNDKGSMVLCLDVMDTAIERYQQLDSARNGIECLGIMRILIDDEGVKRPINRLCGKGQGIGFARFWKIDVDVERPIVFVEAGFDFCLPSCTVMLHKRLYRCHADVKLSGEVRRFCPGVDGVEVWVLAHSVGGEVEHDRLVIELCRGLKQGCGNIGGDGGVTRVTQERWEFIYRKWHATAIHRQKRKT